MLRRFLFVAVLLSLVTQPVVSHADNENTFDPLKAQNTFRQPSNPGLILAQVGTGLAKEDDPITRIKGMGRFVPGDPRLRVAELLLDVKNGKTGEYFYKELGTIGKNKPEVNMLMVNAVKTSIAEIGGDMLLEKFLGARFEGRQGTPVEALIGTYRRDLTNKAIAEVIKDPKIRALAARTNSRVFLAFVGKWASQSPQDFTFSGDIDFSFVGGNAELIIAMRDLFDTIIVRETNGLTMKQLDSFATAHGFATSDVYRGEAGRQYGDDEIVKGNVSRILFDEGRYDLDSDTGKEAILQSLLEESIVEASKRDGIVDKTLSIYFEKLDARANTMTEPMISMEMIRHLEHDIILHSESFPALDTIVKGCKYLYRSNLYFKNQFGVDPSNKALADFATKMTEMAKSASPGDMATAVAEYFKQSGMTQFPAEVDFVPGKDGKKKAILKSNREKALGFLQNCMKNMWSNVERGLRIHLDDLKRKKAEFEEKTKRGDLDEQTVKDMEAYRKKLSQLLKGINTELGEFEKGQIGLPSEVKSLCQEVVSISEDIGKITGMRKLTVEEEKQLEMIKKLLEGQPAEHTRAMALSNMMDLANKFIQRTNARMDWIDDTLMGPFRGDPSFEEFLQDINERNKLLANIETIDDPAVKARIAEFQGTLTNRFRKNTYNLEVALNTLIYKNAVAKGVKKINVTLNEFIQSTQSGRAAMAGLTAFNLAQEFPAYTQAFSRDGFSGFAAEIIRRRVPFGSAAENLYQGKYLMAGWDTMTTIFPPLALPFAAKGVAEYAATATVSYLWSADLELLIDGLYEKATWEEAKTGEALRFKLASVTYKDKQYERQSLEKGESFILNSDVDTVLWANLAQDDPFLELYEELQKHEAAGQKVRDSFVRKYEERWLSLKKAYVGHMIEKLEKRKNAEDASGTGKIVKMYDELMDIAGKLEIKSQVNAAMDAEWDSDNLKALWGWLKNAKRTIWGQPLAEKEATRAAGIVMEYLEKYRAVLAARGQVEEAVAGVFENDGLAAPPTEQHRQRILTGIVFLTGRAGDDEETAKAWKALPAALAAVVEKELLIIKSESEEGAKLDSPYDRETHAKVFFEDYWIKALQQMKVPVISAGSVKDVLNKRVEARKKLVKDYRDHYALLKGTVTVYVRQQHGSKRTALPVTNAEVALKTGETETAVLEQRGEGQYTKSGFKPGTYLLTVKAEGFTATADGKKDELSYTVSMPSPKEGTKALDPITVYLIVKDRGKQALDVTVTPATAVVKESGEGSTLTLTPIVVPKEDSGKLNYQWAVDDKVLRSGKDVSVDEIVPITFSGQGQAGKDVKVTLVVFDEKDRQGNGQSIIKVVPPGLNVRLKSHRTTINRDQSEIVEVEEPRAADESFKYSWKITGDGVGFEKTWSAGYTIMGSEYPGKTLSVTVTVTDKYGSKGQAITSITVKDEDSLAKIPVSIAPQSATISEDGQIELTVSATPFKDSGQLRFNNVAVPKGTTSYRVSFSGKDTTYAPPITTNVTVTVNDEKGRTGEAVASIYVTKKDDKKDSGQTVAVTDPIDSAKLSFAGTAPDIWEGGNYDNGSDRGFNMKRKKASSKGTGECKWEAYVGSEIWGKIDPSFAPRTEAEILSELNRQVESAKAWGKTAKIRAIAIGDFKGHFIDTSVKFSGGGWSDAGFRADGVSAEGRGFLIKGERRIELGYNVGGGGCWTNEDRAFLESQARAAQDDAKAILAGLQLVVNGSIAKTPYKGPKLDGSDMPKVTLSPPSLEKLKVGDTVKVTAEVQNDKPEDIPFTYNWGGTFDGKPEESKKKATITIKPQKPGKYDLSVSVDGQRFNMGGASLQYEVADYKVKIERVPVDTKPVAVSVKTGFKAMLTVDGKPASGSFIYRWQPHPEVTFDKLDASTPDVKASFPKPGRVKVWVQVLETREGRQATVAESEQIEIEVVKPALELSFDPKEPWVGQELKAKLTVKPEVKEIDFRWMPVPDNARQSMESKDGKEITFYLKDDKPAEIQVNARVPKSGEDLGEAKNTIKAKKYTVNVTGPKAMGPKPRVWKEGVGPVDVEKEIAVDQIVEFAADTQPAPLTGPVKYQWTVTSGSCTVSNPTSREARATASAAGGCELTVVIRDKNDVQLGEGKGSFNATISQNEITKAKDKKKEMEEKLAKARAIEREGKFDEAIALIDDVLKIDPKHEEAKQFLAQLKKEKGDADKKIAGINADIDTAKFDEAERELKTLKGRCPQYPPLLAAEKKLAAEREKAQGKAGAELAKVSEAVKARDFKQALTLAGEVRKTTKLNQKQNAELAGLERTARDQEAKKERARQLLTSGEAKLKNYDYDGALADLAGGLSASQDLWSAKDPEPARFATLKTQAETKAKRLKELLPAIQQAAEGKPVPPADELKKALTSADEAKALQPTNERIANYRKLIEQRLAAGEKESEKIKVAKELRDRGEAAQKQGKIPEAISSFRESLKILPDPALEAHVKTLEARLTQDREKVETAKRLRAEGEALQSQGKTAEAVAKYRESLKYVPDARLEEHIKVLEAKLAGETAKIETAKRLRAEGEALQSQGKTAEAVAKYRESLKYVPDARLEEHIKVLESKLAGETAKNETAKRLRAEGEALQSQGKTAEAVAKYRESLKYVPDARLEEHIKVLESKLAGETAKNETAKRLRAEGAALQSQGKMAEAVAKYRESLKYVPDAKLEEHIRVLEAQEAKQVAQRKAADQLWQEGTALSNQGRPGDALAKFKESLKYSSSSERVKYVQDLEGRKTQAERLRSEGTSFQSQGKLREAAGKYRESLGYWPDPALADHIAKIEAEIKKQETQVVTQPPTSGSGGADGTWEVSFNNYRGKMELQRSGSSWSGRLWLDAHQRWEQLTNISYSSAGRLEFTRPISGATQRYSGALSGERLEGTFTQENSATKYAWWAKKTQAGTDKPTVSDASNASFPLQISRNVPRQNSSVFKQNVRNDLTVDAARFDKIPYSMHVSSHDLMITTPAKFCLAGDAGGTKGWTVDNFLLIEILDRSGNLISSALAGLTETVRRNGNPIETIGRPSESFNACEIDVTKLLPVGRPFRLRASAMDYGYVGFVSDVFIVSPKGTSGAVSQPPSPSPTAKGSVIFNNGNTGGVYNNPSRATTFTLRAPHVITLITNYHWNNGRGATPGTIALRGSDGRTYGSWRTSGSPGQGGVPNAYWNASPNVTLPAGTYTVVDSGPATWAQNSGSQGCGHTRVEGYPVSGGTVSTPAVTAGQAAAASLVTAELTNSSRENTHIFTEGETFGPGNRLAPGEKRRVAVTMKSDGSVTFKAGRNGQVMTTKTWRGIPGDSSRVPVVVFDESNPFDKLTVTTGLR